MGKYDSFKLVLENLRGPENLRIRRRRQRTASEDETFQNEFNDRLARKQKIVFEVAMRHDKAALARRFAHLWAQKRIADRESEYFETLSVMMAEMLFRVLNAKTHGAAAKLANDPKQAVKGEIFKLWLDWRSGKTLHKSGAAFHRYAVEQFPIIVDTKTVARWCKEWTTQVSKEGVC